MLGLQGVGLDEAVVLPPVLLEAPQVCVGRVRDQLGFP